MEDKNELRIKIAIAISLVTAILAVSGIIWMASNLASQTKFAYDFAAANQTIPIRMIVAEARIDKFDSIAKDFIRVQTRQEALYSKQAELMNDMKEMERRFNRAN